MPCRYYTEAEERDIAQRQAAETRQELDKVTRIACELMTYIEDKGYDTLDLSNESAKWWRDHQIMDAKRKAAEAKKEAEKAALHAALKAKEEARNRALSKLSEEEKKLLGIY